MDKGWCFKDIVWRSTKLRREFHGFPEMRWKELKTSQHICSVLDALKIPWRICAKTGIVAQIDGGEGGAIAFRADMDGLALEERSGVAWSSTNKGCMHGCGHDGHMAVLLGAAELFQNCRDELPQPVTLVFQPAEEGGFGAREMIADGVLDGVERIFGWHNWPSIPFGKVLCCPGAIMAANGNFKIILTGRGGHASEPEACIDPLPGAAAIILGLQQIVARNLAPQQAAVVSVTTITANGAETIIADRVELTGSLRFEQSDGLEWLTERMREITTHIAAGYGLDAKLEVEPRYPAVMNHEQEVQQVARVLKKVFGPDWQATGIKSPVMASEDFSYYLEKIPGAFMLTGAADPAKKNFPLHSSSYDFNDDLVAPMLRTIIGLAGLQIPEDLPQKSEKLRSTPL